jgi:hypothetical protein
MFTVSVKIQGSGYLVLVGDPNKKGRANTWLYLL